MKTSDDEKLTGVHFTHEYHSEIVPSADDTHKTAEEPDHLEDERPMLFLDIVREKRKYRV